MLNDSDPSLDSLAGYGPFLARLTAVNVGTGTQAGLFLYSFVEQSFATNTGFPRDANPPRQTSPISGYPVSGYALEVNNRLVPGLTSTPLTAPTYTTPLPVPLPQSYVQMRLKGVVKGAPVYEFRWEPLPWIKVTSTTLTTITLPSTQTLKGYPAVVESWDGATTDGSEPTWDDSADAVWLVNLNAEPSVIDGVTVTGSGGPPILGYRYSCRLLGVDSSGVSIWAFENVPITYGQFTSQLALPSTGCTLNVVLPLQGTYLIWLEMYVEATDVPDVGASFTAVLNDNAGESFMLLKQTAPIPTVLSPEEDTDITFGLPIWTNTSSIQGLFTCETASESVQLAYGWESTGEFSTLAMYVSVGFVLVTPTLAYQYLPRLGGTNRILSGLTTVAACGGGSSGSSSSGSSSSGGGGGGPTFEDLCPDQQFDDTYTLTISGPCTALNGTYTLTWNGFAWIWTGTLGGVSWEWQVQDVSGTPGLSATGGSGLATSFTCPPTFTASGTMEFFEGSPLCVGDTINWSVS